MKEVESLLSELSDSPESLLVPSTDLQEKLCQITKSLFDTNVSFRPFGPLPELVIQDCDCEQIWQELLLQQKPLQEFIEAELCALSVEDADSVVQDDDEELDFQEDSEAFDDGDDHDEDEDEDDEDEDGEDDKDESVNNDEIDSLVDSDSSSGISMDINEVHEKKKKKESAPLDFNLKKVHNLVMEQERMDLDGNHLFNEEDAMQLYEDFEDDEDDDDNDDEDEDEGDDVGGAGLLQESGEKQAKYADFFDAPDDGKIDQFDEEEIDADINNDDDDDEMNVNLFPSDQSSLSGDEEEEGKNLSAFERDQVKMKKIIESLENDNVKEKEWTLKGEVSSKARPVNSLLEEHVEFENVGKSAPLVTEEFTDSLENLIKQRILDGAFNDVERKLDENKVFLKTDEENLLPPEVSDEKNKESLAQIYENEISRKLSGKSLDSDQTDLIEKEQQGIQEELRLLFGQLDALTNFNFTPKVPEMSVKVISNESAIQIEEIIPASVSTADRLAPQEIYAYDAKAEGGAPVIKGHSEKSSKEKKKIRSEGTKKIARAKEAALTPEQRERQAALKTLSKQSNVTIKSSSRNESKKTNFSNSSDVFKALQEGADGKKKRK